MLRTIGLALLMCAAGLVSLAQAQFTPDDVETAVGSGTYLDLSNDPLGMSRGGLTMIWSNYTDGAWDFPDGSDSVEFVNGDSADDKTSGNLPGVTPEIQLDVSGLAASTQYYLYLAARARPDTNDEGGDISWGTVSGSLTLLQFTENTIPVGSAKLNANSNAGDFLAVMPVGTVSSDGLGNFTFYVDNGLEFHQDNPDSDPLTLSHGRDRTQWDGILLTTVPPVPEPSAAVLGCLGALSLLGVRRQRNPRSSTVYKDVI
jgi:hypothetical protein